MNGAKITCIITHRSSAIQSLLVLLLGLLQGLHIWNLRATSTTVVIGASVFSTLHTEWHFSQEIIQKEKWIVELSAPLNREARRFLSNNF